MDISRRDLLTAAAALATAAACDSADAVPRKLDGRRLGTIYNNDSNNIIWASTGRDVTPRDYAHAVDAILECRPGILSQDIGQPDPVIYRSSVATTFDKYHADVWLKVLKMLKEEHLVTKDDLTRQGDALRRLYDAHTDPLAITTAQCTRRHAPVMAAFRMNAEDFYQFTVEFSDFGRAHPDWRIPGANCLDPAIPQVYAHRMAIFREVTEKYDIDGIEFDWRRHYHMVSDPLRNHTVLTRMMRETRQMLDDVAHRKRRPRMLLGVRVGPMLDGVFRKEDFPGCYYGSPTNSSCTDLGLDVRRWVREGLVDYLCPALFEPLGLPHTAEFVALCRDTSVGVYPTLSYTYGWISGGSPPVEDSDATRRRHRDDICREALKCYEEGADGVSVYNWFPHLYPPVGKADNAWGKKREWKSRYSESTGFGWVQRAVLPRLKDARALRRWMAQDRTV
jgi:hypothetical protein